RAGNVRLFGSVLHAEDRDGSDLDLLVDPTPQTTLFDLARIQGKLQTMLGVPVDVLTPKALPEKFRDRVLSEAAPL
ncbi:MAG TPA: nucleotidyltransferase domain-containing protein, partial [Methylophilaceae bacterium]|nr:nucleotidyltransferase domain-containing protein [Methylophilaceae bacterium]